MKMTAIMWGSSAPALKRAAEKNGIELTLYSVGRLNEKPEKIPEAISSMNNSDIVILHSFSDTLWEQIGSELKKIGAKVPILCFRLGQSHLGYSTVGPEIITTCNKYMNYNGDENLHNMIHYLRKELFNEDIDVKPPVEVPWEGIYHPDAPAVFTRTDDYLAWYLPLRPPNSPFIGIEFSRMSWTSSDTAIEDTLIKSFETEGLNVIPVFNLRKGFDEIVSDFFTTDGKLQVDAIIKLASAFTGARFTSGKDQTNDKTSLEKSVDLLKRLNIPIFHPIISSHMSIEQWRESPSLTLDAAYAVAMPEFEGMIEPIFIGSSKPTENEENTRHAVPDRCRKVAQRVKKWVELAKKPVHKRKVTFILHNNPCAGVEASVGGAANLDSLESVARILHMMKDAGYEITSPTNGEELIKTILEKKAISESRWTTVQDIVAKGGALEQMDMESFLPYFHSLPRTVQDRIQKTWGDPPGLSMILDGKILITGLSFGNVTIHVQPKRGCYGSRCDGQVCKILHDPGCPPPHQFLATYYWIEHIYKADVIVHVGTHGTLEFLPGKGLGLSDECYPDISIGTIPHLYIYNADNSPEGTIAKRRSYATLVDHMQTVLTQGGLYEELEEIDNLLHQYETAKSDPARAHALQHLIIEAVTAANLDKDMHLTHDLPLEEVVSRAHEALSKIRNTQIQRGMHIFGRLPEGDKRIDFINAIIRFDSGDPSPRRTIAQVMGFDLSDLLENQDKFSYEHGLSNGALLERLEGTTKEFITSVLDKSLTSYDELFKRSVSGEQGQVLDVIRTRILDINRRLEESLEIESLLHGFSGGYIPSGPSGVISRGREDILPTGRNFYSLDPYRVPTKAAWRVGQRLAEALIAKHQNDEGKVPENVAFYWMAMDIMESDGEMLAEMFTLLGVEPVWLPNGQVRSFTLIPLENLGRPRIDITLEITFTLRSNFANCYELLDQAIQAVAVLDEPLEMNYIRKHALGSMKENGGTWRDATLRIFSGGPDGGLGGGVGLAVAASAWKTETDLVDIFVSGGGYAYGKDIQGQNAHEQLVSCLSSVSVTFNKVHTDAKDLLGCCCYFSAHGGITAAARHFSHNHVKPYYGDTREPENIEVRDLADEIRRVVRTKLLNPKWIEGMKEHGYRGAANIAHRVTHVYGWEASTQEVDDWIFDDIAETFVNDAEMREFFEQNNPYALEELARRLLEAQQRGLWDADEQVLEDLRNNYLEIESWLEDQVGEGDHQGGSVDIITKDDIPEWGDAMNDLMTKIHAKHPR